MITTPDREKLNNDPNNDPNLDQKTFGGVSGVQQAKVGILTISDRGAGGLYEDKSGPIIKQLVSDRLNGTVQRTEVIPDELDIIKDTLVEWVDRYQLDLIFTTGGTGFAPRDVTPEAIRENLETILPALPHALELIKNDPAAEQSH